MHTNKQGTPQQTKVKQHAWVKHIIVPVEIVPSFEEGVEFIAFADPEVVAQAEDDAVFGCMDCDTPLSFETSQTGCTGNAS